MAKTERYAKLSVSVPKKLAVEVKRRVGERGVSAFTARALRRELEREELGEFLAELEQELGPPDEKLVAEIMALWPKS